MEMNNSSSTRTTHSVKVGNVTIGGSDFSVIAGPCSIESEQQFLQTAQHVKAHGSVILRGGIWKMRTSSKTFQGLGEDSFSFIKDVLKKVGLNLCVEVTDARQIEQIADFVEMFQVGSRNMHNYSLLKELGQQQKPIMLKRGFAALVDEWIKAAEYITDGGNGNVILCERGIRTFETSTRNTLDLNSVAYVKRHTNFPVIVDPSHGTGVRELVSPLALAAAAVGADGIIVEVHPRPAEALSDGKQALTFDDFSTLMTTLEKVLNALDRRLARPNTSVVGTSTSPLISEMSH